MILLLFADENKIDTFYKPLAAVFRISKQPKITRNIQA